MSCPHTRKPQYHLDIALLNRPCLHGTDHVGPYTDGIINRDLLSNNGHHLLGLNYSHGNKSHIGTGSQVHRPHTRFYRN